MDLIADLLARLGSLGPTIPILRPEEIETPLTGRKQGQAGGLSGYLAAHPQGYVQIYDLSGLLAFEVRELSLILIDAVATDRATLSPLLQALEHALHSTAIRPTPYRLFAAARYETVGQGIVRATLTFQRTTKLPVGGTP